MAVTSHHKVSRKALKQPDEFVSAFQRIGDLIAANLTRVIIGAVVLVLAIVFVFIASFYSEHRQQIASEQFYHAINSLSGKDYKSAHQDFSELAQKDSGRALGDLAHLYLAATYLAQNQASKARDEVRNSLAENGNYLFRQMALMQLGIANEDLGDYRDAHSAYVKAAQLEGPEKARAEVSAARTLALIGDRQGAITAYQQFLRENPYAQQRAGVIEALAQMGAPPQPPVKEISIPGAAGTANKTR